MAARSLGVTKRLLAFFRINQPTFAPLSIHSRILACTRASRSDGERSSTTKSGHSGRNFFFCSGVSVASRDRRTQEASGERAAPLGRMYSTLESKSFPRLSRLAQVYN